MFTRILSVTQPAIPFVFVLALSSCAPGTETSAFEISNGSFERHGIRGWIPWSPYPEVISSVSYSASEGQAYKGRKYLHLKNSAGSSEKYFFLGKKITGSFPAISFVRFTGYVRTTDEAGIILEASAGGKPLGGDASMPRNAPADGRWNRVELKTFIPGGADELTVSCFLKGNGEASFDDFSIEQIPYDPSVFAPLTGPGIACLHGAEDFKASRDLDKLEVIFPIPDVTRHQAPISFRVKVEPQEKLVSSQVFRRSESNLMCRVTLGPFKKGEIIKLRHWSDIILSSASFDRIPDTVPIPPAGEYPPEVLPWLEPTISVQCDHLKITKPACGLLEESERDAAAFVQKMLNYIRTKEYDRKGPVYERVDAVEAIDHGGFCTSYANLAAALCRAAGIPARVQAVILTWNTPLYMHYITEVYLQDFGWIPCEPSQNAFGYQPFRMIYVSRADIADEHASFGGHGALGVPKWSMTEWDPNSGVTLSGTPLGYQTCGRTAYPIAQFPDDAELAPILDAAQRIWREYLRAKSGEFQNTELAAALEQEIKAAPPTLTALKKHLDQLGKLIFSKDSFKGCNRSHFPGNMNSK